MPLRRKQQPRRASGRLQVFAPTVFDALVSDKLIKHPMPFPVICLQSSRPTRQRKRGRGLQGREDDLFHTLMSFLDSLIGFHDLYALGSARARLR